MALNRVNLNRVSLKRMSVPGTGGAVTPATPAGTNVAIQIFTESSSWTAPTGVTEVEYLVVAGGGVLAAVVLVVIVLVQVYQ
jgi:hypothetical protein